jgi:hypothetical protein
MLAFVLRRHVHPGRWTACALACVRGDVGSLRDMLPHLSVDYAKSVRPGLTHHAVYGGPQTLALLAERELLEIEALDGRGRTPLMCAAAHARATPAGAEPAAFAVPLSELVTVQSCRWLIAAGAEVDARDPHGWTALHWAAFASSMRTASVLLEFGAAVDGLDHRGRTPLMIACLNRPGAKENEAIDVLLRAGADPDIRDDHGWTSLHYLAAGSRGGDDRSLALTLLARGARPSRDRAGRSPADVAAWRELLHTGGPLAPDTAVAAGPGPYRLPSEPELAERLIDQLVPELPDPSTFTAKSRLARVDLEDWVVWADWLQSRGDPRGELVTTSLACVGRGGAKRWRMLEALNHVKARTRSTSHAGLYCADALAPAEDTLLHPTWTHGFMTKVTIDGRLSRQVEVHAAEIATRLLGSEPLLADMRICLPDDHARWAELIAALGRIEPCTRLRRLVLHGLPPSLPDLDVLAHALPKLRSVWLIGHTKILWGRVRWPGPTHLRLRHGSRSEWRQGNIDVALELPNLTHFDMALPIGSRTVDEEVDGSRYTLDMVAGVRHLRLSPLGPRFATSLLGSPTIASLRTLELVGVRGSALDAVVGHTDVLRNLARVRLSVAPTVAIQRAVLIDRLRQELPNFELDTGPCKRQPFSPWSQITVGSTQ